ncbi:ABC transporter ATP-binding protein [Fundicoccus culcitae]|uniref:ATP-binding cassette domain-containing protein n=1 Tax=Fundicoccus culcitae TaxID=2969821 RepID=A0ABY5P4R6_9LACT|nr:ATP-binding cassette domain-containing protein [Fundicoccus culcitae]UUX33403.1 ATP-binding cassette domain-containing protein [Fundicoccus culcitae]
MEKSTIISVKNIKKYYKLPRSHPFQRQQESIKAVDDVSFDIYKSETFGIVGESGSGKSTVARLVNQLIRPTAGDIYYYDQELASANKAQLMDYRKQVQMVFQSPYGTLDPRKTIEFSLLEPFAIHNIGTTAERTQRVATLLDYVSLPKSTLNKYPHEFSGGQLQRINIARAISLEPELLILDESVSALDVSVQAQILNLLNDLQEELGLTYLFISHDLNVVRYMCDRIAVMNQGKIVELNDAKEIYDNPQASYTRSLLSAIPISSPYLRTT